MTKHLSDQIKKLRNSRGWSQELLAEKTELSLRTIQRVENSETEPRGHTLKRISEALQVTPDELLEWNRTEDKSTLLVLNLSALSFLFFPVLGVLVPLIIWIAKKDVIKGMTEAGKELINFQITFCLWFYLLKGTLYILPFLEIEFFEALNQIEFFPPYLIVPAIFGIFYLYNIGLILYNSHRIRNGKGVRYVPKIPFLR